MINQRIFLKSNSLDDRIYPKISYISRFLLLYFIVHNKSLNELKIIELSQLSQFYFALIVTNKEAQFSPVDTNKYFSKDSLIIVKIEIVSW